LSSFKIFLGSPRFARTTWSANGKTKTSHENLRDLRDIKDLNDDLECQLKDKNFTSHENLFSKMQIFNESVFDTLEKC
jgi:hypothetical protein